MVDSGRGRSAAAGRSTTSACSTTAKRLLRHILTCCGPTIDAGVPRRGARAELRVGVPRRAAQTCCRTTADAQRLREQTLPAQRVPGEAGDALPACRRSRKAIVHGHCHHKALMRMSDEEALLEKTGPRLEILDPAAAAWPARSASSADKYDVSEACGDAGLLPAVRQAGLTTLIVADGFSCREQIAQSTKRHALHLAEVIALAIRDGSSGPSGMEPERYSVTPRQRAVTRSMLRAGLTGPRGHRRRGNGCHAVGVQAVVDMTPIGRTRWAIAEGYIPAPESRARSRR